MAKAEDIIKIATREIGTKEDPPESNSVKYNDWYYGKEKKVSGPAYPWCAAFVSWVFYQVEPSLIKKSASCATIGDWFKARGRFFKKDPQPGDLIFFKFGTNNRWTNHIGIVESVNKNGSVNTIEGNTSLTSQDNGGCVMARVRKINSTVVGFGRPDYDNVRPTLKIGSKGKYVKELQELLVKNGFLVDIDSDFGPATRQAVISYQGAQNLYKDGVVGVNTWDKLLKN